MHGEYRVGQRLKIQGELCTVRFVGRIPAWPTDVALGVEWDNAQRGKNDGTLDGVRYFATSKGDSSGSFRKSSSKKLLGSAGTSFVRALCDKYGEGFDAYYTYADLFKHAGNVVLGRERDDKFDEIRIGTKVVETYGLERLDKLQSNFQTLEIVSLDSCNIADNRPEFGHSVEVNDVLPNVKILDLSFNLFDDFKDIWSIVRGSNVQKLVLNGNRCTCDTYDSAEAVPLSSVRELSLAATLFTSLVPIATCFPAVEVLNLSAQLADSGPDLNAVSALQSLKSLDLSFNNFTEIPHDVLSRIPSLKKLTLNNNKIAVVKPGWCLPEITELDLRRNLLSSWSDVDALATNFPNLESLRINENGIQALADPNDNNNDLTVVHLVSRLPKSLKHLNRTAVTTNERTNYELYFISLIRRDPLHYQDFFATSRFKELSLLYGLDVDSITSKSLAATTVGRLAANVCSLVIEFEGMRAPTRTFKYYTVGQLKGIISKMVQRPVVEFTVYYDVNASVKEYLRDDLSTIHSTGISDGEVIHVESH